MFWRTAGSLVQAGFPTHEWLQIETETLGSFFKTLKTSEMGRAVNPTRLDGKLRAISYTSFSRHPAVGRPAGLLYAVFPQIQHFT